MSLLYECINTVIAVLISISTGMPSHGASIQVSLIIRLILKVKTFYLSKNFTDLY